MKKLVGVGVLLLYTTLQASNVLEKFCQFMHGNIQRRGHSSPITDEFDYYDGRLPFTKDLEVYEQNGSTGFFYKLNASSVAFIRDVEELQRAGGIYTVKFVREEAECQVVNVSLRFVNGQVVTVPYKLYFNSAGLIFKIERLSQSAKIT